MYNSGGRQPPGGTSQREVCVEKYTPFRTTRAQILKEVYHLHLLDIPPPTKWQLGTSLKEWCEFHRTHGHMTRLMVTWDILSRKGKMKSAPRESSLGRIGAELWEETVIGSIIYLVVATRVCQDPEVGPLPHLGTIATIAGGGSIAEMSTSTRKRYSWLILAIQERPAIRHDPPITFTDEDYECTVSHSDDPMVISVIISTIEWNRFRSDVSLNDTGHQVNKEGGQDDIHNGQFPNILQCNTRPTSPKPIASNSVHSTSMHEVSSQ
ncbi:hypothetical protein CR513_05349, partial [Mucuna pruriens]